MFHEPRLFTCGVQLPLEHPAVYTAADRRARLRLRHGHGRSHRPRSRSPRRHQADDRRAGRDGRARAWRGCMAGTGANGCCVTPRWAGSNRSCRGTAWRWRRCRASAGPARRRRSRRGDVVDHRRAHRVDLEALHQNADRIRRRPCCTVTRTSATRTCCPATRSGFLDWQVARRGNWSLDLGYFLQGALTVDDRRRSERALLEEYREALGLPADGDAVNRRDLAALPRIGGTRTDPVAVSRICSVAGDSTRRPRLGGRHGCNGVARSRTVRHGVPAVLADSAR